jgi:hypothetical protein
MQASCHSLRSAWYALQICNPFVSLMLGARLQDTGIADVARVLLAKSETSLNKTGLKR